LHTASTKQGPASHDQQQLMAWSFATGHGTKLTILTPELVGCTTNSGDWAMLVHAIHEAFKALCDVVKGTSLNHCMPAQATPFSKL
jgi:hypothetical protein